MAERQTAVGGGGGAGSHETRYFGGLIGNKEIFVMTMISVALYLIEGEHAQVRDFPNDAPRKLHKRALA